MLASETLLQPFFLGDIRLKNRIVMAPMTRNMANDDLSPTEQMAEYYARRADAGLIITEGTIIAPDGRGYSNVPGIFTDAHIDKWHQVTDAVHRRDGRIFLQIWHVGRVSHPHFLDGELPVSASVTTMTGKVSRANHLTYGQSREASRSDIKRLVADYANACKNAIKAGFDGVEIHGANGYLIDQFLHYDTNHRHDEYGASSQNMARFALEVVAACCEEIGSNRVGIRLSPGAYLNQITGDRRDADVFQFLLTQLNETGLAYVHTGNFNDALTFKELADKTMTAFIREYYRGVVIASGSYDLKQAGQGIKNHQFDLIAMGRPFIANPDLITRIKNQSELIPYQPGMLETLY
ncbi:alkene reductase [Legionella spiritensis]|uniref:NADH-dependent flavin oxidoreductase, Oye family n=1 Tax=Legionella spiritensis TaxID=452 RepID=A0A0W0ZA96_LEGSP|nr:alkene reductase [Legionella spiritensis]KTD65983.1 NADH-dependent flavin oxidoreductase, Oye family [Legionella spiritensis]SNV48920.1 NADH-dependent flavin oxidoreductase, Oye family [Legionella spiritensis]